MTQRRRSVTARKRRPRAHHRALAERIGAFWRPEPKAKVKSKSPQTRRRHAPRRRKRHLLRVSRRTRKVIYWGTVVGLWLVLASSAALAWVALGIPNTSGLWRAAAGPSVTVLDANRSVLATRGAVYGNDVPLEKMSPYLPLAVIATEDRRFYGHWGLDPVSVMRALFNNIEEGHVVEGGSTITQQLAKNVFLTPERTFKRKLEEAMLALWLEWRFTKDQILALYLNRVYFGAGTYGVEAAARRYFDKPPSQLTLAESALLAGLLKAPSRFAPTNDPDLARKRAALVLDAMLEAGFITKEARTKAGRTPLKLAAGTRSMGAQYFADWVLDTLPDLIGPTRGELVVETTLHLPFQRAAERAVDRALEATGQALGASQVALVSIDRDGAIRAMVGGRAYGASQFNRATQAKRQPGSAFKPFVYLAALEHGRTPSWHINDAPIQIGHWSPANFGGGHKGDVTLETALAESINTVAVRLTESIGREAVIETAQRLGIHSPLAPVPSLALGTQEVGLLELTSAYVPFARAGELPRVHGIERVLTRQGRVLYMAKAVPMARVVASADAGAMNAMLRAALLRGTGLKARLSNRDAAGKTGTSGDFRDAWFVGYTADLVTGVWVGNDDGTPMRKVTGGGLPAEIWHAYMERAAAVYPSRPLPDGGYAPLTDSEIAEGTSSERFLGFFERISSLLHGHSHEQSRKSSPTAEGTPPKDASH